MINAGWKSRKKMKKTKTKQRKSKENKGNYLMELKSKIMGNQKMAEDLFQERSKGIRGTGGKWCYEPLEIKGSNKNMML